MLTYPHHVEAILLKVRDEPIGYAIGVENWFRARDFVCDRLGRTETTPVSAMRPGWGAWLEGEPTFRFFAADLDARDHYGPSLAEMCRGTTGWGGEE